MMKRVEALVGADPDSLAFYYDEPHVSGDGRVVELRCRIEGPAGQVSFTETVVLPDLPDPRPVDDAFLALTRLLNLAAGLSYYKALVPARMVVPGGLSTHEREFLADLVRGGLAEFAYRNDLPRALTPIIEAPERSDPPLPGARTSSEGRALVAVGGGKDSIVTLEALRHALPEVALFSVNEYDPINATARAAGLPLLTARRTLDPRLFELNEAGAHNGHVPVTAINSLIGCLTALRGGFEHVVFSNEASSSYGNLRWSGVEVNHQWSKSIEFEALLRRHLEGVGVEYVSFLRPLTELAIMRRFADHTAYHPVFTSCNRSFHLDPALRSSWCGHCPKCVFVGLMLAPFVSREQLLAIFGRDVLADPANLPLILDLLAIGEGHKPFECVGEPEETRAAVALLRDHPDWRDLELLSRPEVAVIEVDEAELARLFSFSDRHFLTGSLEKAAREVL